MFAELFPQLTEQGYQGRIVPIEHLADLREEIEGRYKQGMLDPELYELYLTEFDFRPPGTLPEARSILVVAVPQPRVRVTFGWDGGSVQADIPPTYGEEKKDRRVRERLAQVLAPAGARIAEARLPKKLLATRSGLAVYGKNNITYVPGLGSFYGLVAMYSDLAAREDPWQEPMMMERCESCSACLRHCPTGAIAAYRFLLHAERCLTFLNEKPADVPFPGWLDPVWHNCLVGCLHCQRVCPENREVWPWVEEGAEFSREETALLLEGCPVDRLPEGTAEKLERLDVEGLKDLLPRNLEALLSPRR
ncbi:MAG: 4Fe-4S double cluster binding domain-containing protein [Anaerolineae bacterium]